MEIDKKKICIFNNEKRKDLKFTCYDLNVLFFKSNIEPYIEINYQTECITWKRKN